MRHHEHHPRCLVFRPSRRSQRAAIRELLRPWEVKALAMRLRNEADFEEATFASYVAWVFDRAFETGQLEYFSDPPHPRGLDQWCSPSLTLERGGGDCDDLAILAASIIQAGRGSACVVTGSVRTRAGVAGHAWVEGRDHWGHYLLEATSGSFYRYRPGIYSPEMFLDREDWLAA